MDTAAEIILESLCLLCYDREVRSLSLATATARHHAAETSRESVVRTAAPRSFLQANNVHTTPCLLLYIFYLIYKVYIIICY